MAEFTVGPRAVTAGHRVHDHDRLDSTNSEALRLARDGERGPLWIVAREQVAGRGRRGRQWQSAPGNLAVSFLFADRIAPQVAATLGFAASLAVRNVCTELAPGIDFAVKWPNDVLADGKKVAGILLESEAQGDELAIVTGFGLNLAQAPGDTIFPAAALAQLGVTVSPQMAFSRLSDAYHDMLEIWQSGRGFDAVRALWLDHAQGLGQSVSIRVGGRVEAGIFETLDAEGRLMLRGADGGLSSISAGDVFFGDAASAGEAA